MESSDSLAHCISLDFKLRAGIARSIKPVKYPNKETVASEIIGPQWIPELQCFFNHFMAKFRYFHELTFKTLRLSLEASKSHAERNNILRRISMPQIACGLKKLDWSKVLIQEVFAFANIEFFVFLKPVKRPLCVIQDPVDSLDNAVVAKTPHVSETLASLASAQRANPTLKNLFQWVTCDTPPGTQELQGLPRATWQLANEFQRLTIINDVLYREFVRKGCPSQYQQLIPASLVLQN